MLRILENRRKNCRKCREKSRILENKVTRARLARVCKSTYKKPNKIAKCNCNPRPYTLSKKGAAAKIKMRKSLNPFFAFRREHKIICQLTNAIEFTKSASVAWRSMNATKKASYRNKFKRSRKMVYVARNKKKAGKRNPAVKKDPRGKMHDGVKDAEKSGEDVDDDVILIEDLDDDLVLFEEKMSSKNEMSLKGNPNPKNVGGGTAREGNCEMNTYSKNLSFQDCNIM